MIIRWTGNNSKDLEKLIRQLGFLGIYKLENGYFSCDSPNGKSVKLEEGDLVVFEKDRISIVGGNMTDKKKFIEEKIYDEGYEAFFEDFPLKWCVYPEGSKERELWEEGWFDARMVSQVDL